jgi:hypothetical protein
MIDKVLPRKLDTSKDARIREKNTMFFAENLSVGDDFFSNEGENGGNVGVLKPKPGNEAVDQSSDLFSQSNSVRTVIGSVEDTRSNVIYFFVFATNANEQGVYAFDPDNVLGGGPGVKGVYVSNQFNFPSNGFVKADIVYTSDTEH